MNKKQLIIAAIAATLSVSGAFAATDITGVNGNNGVFNITPDKLNGEVGYRKYDNFNLSAGDIDCHSLPLPMVVTALWIGCCLFR